jgi:hypothetical protein
MSQPNDCILEALVAGGYGNQYNDGLLEWAQANGATAEQLNNALLQAAQANGGTSNDLNDAWFEALGAMGLTGTLNDRLSEFWCVLGGVFGFGAVSAAMGGSQQFVVITFNDVPQNFSPIAGVQILVDGVDDLNSAISPLPVGSTLTYQLNSLAPDDVLIQWVYSQPPGLISDGVDLAPSRTLVAQQESTVPATAILTDGLVPILTSPALEFILTS